jgi:hypothetical protein
MSAESAATSASPWYSGERRQPPEPAAAAAGDAEVKPGAKGVYPGRIGLQKRDRRLRQHERNVALEPVVQPLALVRDRVVLGAQVDEDVVAVQLDREAAQLVRPLVERAAGREVEAGVMPVASEDPVADRAAVKREAHVRAAIVNRGHFAVLCEQTERVPVDVDDEPSRLAQLGE